MTPVRGDRLTTQIFDLIDVQAIVAEALPPRGQILAGPLTGGVQDFVHQKLDEVLSSNQFREGWYPSESIRSFADRGSPSKRGQPRGYIQRPGGLLNLLPIVNEALQRIETRASGLFNKNVNLPDVSSGEVPAEVRARISSALGVDVPKDFGEIVIFQSDKLQAAQDAVSSSRSRDRHPRDPCDRSRRASAMDIAPPPQDPARARCGLDGGDRRGKTPHLLGRRSGRPGWQRNPTGNER